MADKKKPSKTAKPSGAKQQSGKKKRELSMDDLAKVAGGARKKRSMREP